MEIPSIPDSIVIRNFDWTGFGYFLVIKILENLVSSEFETSFENPGDQMNYQKGYFTFQRENQFKTYIEAKICFDQNVTNLNQNYGNQIEIIDNESYIFYSTGFRLIG